MPISFILFLGFWRLAKQVWATKCLLHIYKAAVSTKSLEKPQNFENQQYIKPSHCPEIKLVSSVISTQGFILKSLSSKKTKKKKNSTVFYL